jgi:hypothetical protein
MASTCAIATDVFAYQPNVLVLPAAAWLVGIAIAMPTATEFGKRSRVVQCSQARIRAPVTPAAA